MQRGDGAVPVSGPTRAALALALALGFAAIAPARAQDRDPDDARVEARRLLDEGLRAAQEARWEDARAAFARSYARVRRPITLLNLAGAEAQSGRLLDSAASYRRFLEIATEGRAAVHRAEAEAALAEVVARTPTLRARLDGLRPGDRLRLDGRPAQPDALAAGVAVDPGRHELVVERDGHGPRGATLEVAERERAAAVLDLRPASWPPLAGDGPPTPPPRARSRSRRGPREAEGSRSAWSSPWLWTGVGAVVLGGVVLGIVLGAGDAREPTRGDIPPFRQGL